LELMPSILALTSLQYRSSKKSGHDMPFQKGQSGNPRGRPKGIQDRRVALRAMLDPHKDALVEKAVELALGGDTQALKLCLERLIPPIKSTELPVQAPIQGDTLADQARAVLGLAGTGEHSLRDVTGLMQAVATMARVIDVDELERRITALEHRGG
jgi:hypothetical protein